MRVFGLIRNVVMGLFGFKYYVGFDVDSNGKTLYVMMRHHRLSDKYRVVKTWYEERP